ncbi:hypothetical protein ASF74_11735 [Arthrobacter sp. Leaf145]|nr:hypothetical protein ASF74_11735 [Arthrobacter sp. Leaf145]
MGELAEMVARGAALPLRLRSSEHTLYSLGRPLAALYAEQTSSCHNGNDLVRAGFTTAVVEAPGMSAIIPESMRVEQVLGEQIRLASFNTRVPDGGNLRVHVLWGERGTKADRARIRELRIHILRLHSIYELMRFLASPVIVRSKLPLAHEQGQVGFDHLQRTLLECVRVVRRRDAIAGTPLPAVLNAAFFSRNFMDRDLQSMLTQTLGSMRRRVRDEIEILARDEIRRERENTLAEAERTDKAASTIIINLAKGAIMGDTYKVGKNTGPIGPNSTVVGANGRNASVVGPVIGTGSNVGGHITADVVTINQQDFSREHLLADLAALRDHFMSNLDRKGAKITDELRAAERSIEEGDHSGLVGSLKKAGSWISGAVGQIGTGLAQAAIEAAMGMS